MPTADPATVTGLPPSIAAAREDLTPMLSQYADLCAAHEDALVLFQVGDFYEAFCEAAAEVARVCEVTLTQREDSTGEYPMAGIPIDNATSYLESLLDAGYRVALADQVEDAEAASGLVDRAVTQVITPGTVVDEELSSSGATNYVAAVVRGNEDGGGNRGVDGDPPRVARGLAAVDVATGECLVTSGDAETVAEELERIDPAEVVYGPETEFRGSAGGGDARWMETEIDDDLFRGSVASDRLEPYLASPKRRFANDAELRATGAVLAYAEYTQGDDGPLEYVSRIRRYDPRDRLRLDAAARRSLELFENRGLGASDTLFDVIDRTSCALGRRCLERWLRRPLVDADRIRSRHDAVEWLVSRPIVRETIDDRLASAYDLERLVGRVSRGRANARDLRSLHATLEVVPDLRDALVEETDETGASGTAGSEATTGAKTATGEGRAGHADEAGHEGPAGGEDRPGDGSRSADGPCSHLEELRERLDPLAETRDLIDRAIVADPPQEITDGDVIREGFDDELDDLRRTEREGREWIADLEQRERERTGIDSLTVGHTQVHGYYIEVTDPNLDRVPDDYHRRQTLKNSERFYTPELKEREDEILGAAERADAMEYELFREIRETVAAESERLQALAEALAELDALRSLSTVAVENDYVRPEIVEPGDGGGEDSDDGSEADGEDNDDGDAPGIEIEGGRHPVVERTGEFVPNDADLPSGSVAIITGPNMSGKSTYMRQVALAVVLAQIGSFLPAQAARVRIVDRVFTRVGASDDIAGGHSTFMREMSELTEILHDATADSLVLLDEVGRGTATTDGRAIARAAAEFVHDELEATTLFATHYHELTDLADDRERVFNLHFTATREDGDVTFLHRVARGASSSSYGIEVAELAGVPEPVVRRSRELLEEDAADADASEELPGSERGSAGPDALEDGFVLGDPSSDESTRDDATLREFLDGDGSDRSEPEPESASTSTSEPDPEPKPGADGRNGSHAPRDHLADAVRDLDVATMTPVEALNVLAELKRELKR
ncbi:DNA mismatch repair protein MutS [Halopenitus salinus]|uniref:DNA mismatch repair protein MutS n=1 Tax=Halopenitus salinus TaxID=1198295 RepID=A0ABD5UV99_9EURY